MNSYEENMRKNHLEIEDEYKNEDEIKKCEIRMNNNLISFSYFYKFKSKGKYIMRYSFKNNINNTCFMFFGCKLLTNIDLSNFDANNVTNMKFMFAECSSLNQINLSNFNTINVTNMHGMFHKCSSLKKENIITKDDKILKEYEN